MSNGKASSATVLNAMRQLKQNVITRSGRVHMPNSRYLNGDGAGGGGGRGGVGGGGQGGGGGGGVDFEPPPSANGEVAPELFLEEGPSRDEAETESRDEADSRQEMETESRDDEEEEALPLKKKTRGEAGVPRDEPKTQAAKYFIIPDDVE